MQRRYVDIPLGATPVETDSDARVGPPRLRRVRNMRYVRDGALRRRGPFSAVSPSPGTIDRVWTDGERAYSWRQSTGEVKALSDAAAVWSSLGEHDVAQLSGTATLRVDSQLSGASCTAGLVVGSRVYTIITAEVAGASAVEVQVWVTDDSGAVVGQTRLASATATFSVSSSRIVVSGSSACVYCYEQYAPFDTRISYVTITISSGAVSFGALTATTFPDPYSTFECLETGEFAFHESATLIRFGYLSATGAVLSSSTYTRGTAATYTTISIARKSASQFAILFWDSSLTWQIRSYNSSFVLQHSRLIQGPATDVMTGVGIGAAYPQPATSNAVQVAISVGNVTPNAGVYLVLWDGTSGATITAVQTLHERLISRLMTNGDASTGSGSTDRVSAWTFPNNDVYEPDPLTSRVILRRLRGTSTHVIGSWEYRPSNWTGISVFRPPACGVPNAAGSSATSLAAIPQSDRALSWVRIALYPGAANPPAGIVVNRTLLLGGMAPREYAPGNSGAPAITTYGSNSIRGTLSGFLSAPMEPPLAGAAGTLAAGTYSYLVTYGYVDSAGVAHRAIGPVSTYTLTAAGAVSVAASVPTWGEGRLRVEFWRTLNGGSTFYYLRGTTTPNSSFRYTFTDETSDSLLDENEVLNLSSPIELWWPPVTSWAQRDGRVFALDAARNRVIGSTWGSLAYDSTVTVDAVDGSPLVAIGATPSAVYMFAERSAWAFTGEGPDPAGAGSFSAPVRIDATLGCTGPLGVSAPFGDALMVVTHRGPALASGGQLRLMDAGRDLPQTETAWTEPSAVVVWPDFEEVVIATSSALYVWHQRYGRWVEWTAVATGATVYDGDLWIVRSSTLYAYQHADGGQSDYGNTTYRASWETSFLDLGGLVGHGYTKCTGWGLRGTFPDTGTAALSLRIDDVTDTTVDSAAINWNTLYSGLPGDLPEPSQCWHKTGTRRMSTVQFRFAESNPATERLEFTHLLIEALVSGRRRRLRSSRLI